MEVSWPQIQPEQFYLNKLFAGAVCTEKDLMVEYEMTRAEAKSAMKNAITIVKHQRRLELLIESGEDSEEVLESFPLKTEKFPQLQTI